MDDTKNISSTLRSKQVLDEMTEKGVEIYNYGLGENPLSPPNFYVQMVQKYANEKKYSSCCGIPTLNHILINKYNDENKNENCVLVGNGLKELIFILQLAFHGKIIHITPSWVSYKEQIDVLHKNDDLIQFETSIENNYRIDVIRFEEMLKQQGDVPKLIFFNNPNNPTGLAYDDHEIETLAHIIRKHNGIVFADEIYLNLYHNKKVTSISNYIPDITIRGSSVSKDLSCGGYRLGWLVFPTQLTTFYNKCRQLASSIYSCASLPIQHATSQILAQSELCHSYFKKSREIFAHVLTRVCDLLEGSNLIFIKPNATWYMLINFDNYKEKLALRNVHDSITLSNYLLEKVSILTVAGQYFNATGLNLRFSFIDFKYKILTKEDTDDEINVNIDKMLQGINIMITFLKSL